MPSTGARARSSDASPTPSSTASSIGGGILPSRSACGWSASPMTACNTSGRLRTYAGSSGLVGRPGDLGDVELLHAEDGLHRALRPLGVGIADHVVHERGDDLPRQAELVLEPAA